MSSSVRLETDGNKDIHQRMMTLHDSNRFMLESKLSCDVIFKIRREYNTTVNDPVERRPINDGGSEQHIYDVAHSLTATRQRDDITSAPRDREGAYDVARSISGTRRPDVTSPRDADGIYDVIPGDDDKRNSDVIPDSDVSQPEVIRVPAHMYILRSRCPQLAALAVRSTENPAAISEQTAEGGHRINYEIELDDITVDVLTEVLRFLYYEKVQLTISNVFGVLHAVRKYSVPLLASISVKYIHSIISVKTVCRVLQNSLASREEALINVCTEFISRNTESVLNDASFLRTNEAVVDLITSLDYLTINEVDLFARCVQWARTCVAQRQDSSRGERNGLGELVGAELRRALGGVISNNRIRFPVMALEEFCQTVVRLDVLNDAETVEVYNYLACPGRNKPMTRYITARRHGHEMSMNGIFSERIGEQSREKLTRAPTPAGMSSTVFRSVFFHW